MPALTTIARLTCANGLRRPVTWLAIGLGLLLLLLSLLFGQFNFVPDDRQRLLISAGVAIVLLVGLYLGVSTASEAIHDELASRTALTLFAKPIGRGSFLFGKALGAWTTAAVACLSLAAAHLVLLAAVDQWGFFLDPQASRPPERPPPYGRLLAAYLLVLAHTGVLTSLAAALAVRLPLVVNLGACFACFVLAHLLAASGWHGAVIIPALDLLHLDEALQFDDLGLGYPYLVLGLGHATLYSLGSLLIGLSLFQAQDIP